jgi:hypothetical protein
MSYKEPRKTQSKKDCECEACRGQIKKGSECIVDPKTKQVWHTKCKK